MTIGKVVDYFITEYKNAMNNTYVQKPISYALYQTWKWSDDKEKPRKGAGITNKEAIKYIIVKSIESAKNYEIADGYSHIVSCDDCPYWSDCRNKRNCDEYILDKLEKQE